MRNDLVLVLVVITALAFDFTNGFHDTGNAMATSIATGALPPRVAVALSGLLNLVGAFLSLAVAATIASGLVNTAEVTLRWWRRPGRRHHLEPAHLALRHPVEFLARAHRRRDRLDAGRRGRLGGPVEGTGLQGRHPGRPVADHRRRGRRDRHLAALPDQPQPDPGGPQPRLPHRAGRVGLHGVAGPRHQRRAEDDGRHHPGPDRERDAGPPGRRRRSGSSSPARWPSASAPTWAAGG